MVAINTGIEWTDHTFNPWTGCTNISPGCDNCYAEAWSKRSGHVKWGNSPRKRTTESYWKAPAIWQSKAALFQSQHGRRQRVFCASLADVFDNQVDPSWRADLFEVIRATPSLDWQLLTKRPQNIRKMLPLDWGTEGYDNVWLGFTAEDQARFDQRKKVIEQVPAAVWFVSYEPAIGSLRISGGDPKPDWLIVGGESGHGARPMDSTWVRDVISDCEAFSIAPFFKQWGAFGNNPLVSESRMALDEVKKIDVHGKGGGLLDGKIVRRFPSTLHRSQSKKTNAA
ncbi:phage Gp37/Gp68 family protein [Rhizobium leguminosarum bv. viciae]|nr:phage Gp37/Gp68 family protein [Rhizobium leguminosarum]TBY30821.1 phage Gp37/Gp68 family protein [Rhizobium leguminosarum bv. viciae]TBY35887.1 phage Gp37/Gp68 family protein [Rhizobium leguminosarum bv. viciae]TCA94828.1 phage Gp37/Gp68 family protein [Rhizobium leguminosarum bv. viciae]